MSLAAAVYSRWNAASLHSSIAVLYRANPNADIFGATPEDLSTKSLPRAEYYIEDDSPDIHTVDYRIRKAYLTFRIYHTNAATLETVLDSIEQNFDNAENASTGPMTLSSGTLLCVEFAGGRQIEPLDENVFLGTLQFSITWQKSRTTPS